VESTVSRTDRQPLAAGRPTLPVLLALHAGGRGREDLQPLDRDGRGAALAEAVGALLQPAEGVLELGAAVEDGPQQGLRGVPLRRLGATVGLVVAGGVADLHQPQHLALQHRLLVLRGQLVVTGLQGAPDLVDLRLGSARTDLVVDEHRCLPFWASRSAGAPVRGPGPWSSTRGRITRAL
jgi:hypothetical protein